jgi:sulfatase maturation enzyme AslB (radical SAM superfamily)
MDIQKEDHAILKNIIHSSLSNYNIKNNIELVIRPECNQKCKYCYLI